MKTYVLKNTNLPRPLPAEFAENKKGRAKRPVQELRLIASLLSLPTVWILATAGFDLGKIKDSFQHFVNYGLHT